MDLQRALADGEAFVKNAADEMDRKILREEQLYFIDNQVEAIDTYLADSEELAAGNDELGGLRDKLREAKGQLEKKATAFLAAQDGEDIPEDLSPEENAADLLAAGKEFIALADEALKAKVKKVDDLPNWEDPLTTLNSYLADSEVFVKVNDELGAVRDEIKTRKGELQKRISDMLGDWRASDAAGGDD